MTMPAYQSTISSFFKKQAARKLPGRPKKRRGRNGGRKKTIAEERTLRRQIVQEAKEKEATEPKVKLTRTSFIQGSEAYGILNEAVSRWNGIDKEVGKKHTMSKEAFVNEYVARGID